MKIIITENQLRELVLNEGVTPNKKKDFTSDLNVASQKIWNHIREWESLRTFAYDDHIYPSIPFKKGNSLKGTLTIGYGHTGEDVYPEQKISEKDADNFLIKDVNNAANCIKRWVGRQKDRDTINNTKYHLLTQGMYEAMIDIVFNRGCGWFVKSEILSNIENGEYNSAKQKISKLSGDSGRWDKTSELFCSKGC